jgi:hypothetical protein
LAQKEAITNVASAARADHKYYCSRDLVLYGDAIPETHPIWRGFCGCFGCLFWQTWSESEREREREREIERKRERGRERESEEERERG